MPGSARDTTVAALVQFVHDLTFADLGPVAVHAAKRSLVDSVGCALGAFDAAPVVAVRRMAMASTAQAPATLFGSGDRTTVELAALVNGGMIRYLDFSDDYFAGHGDVGPHPSDNIGAVLAAVESAHGDGRQLILGIAAAYEVCGQMAGQSLVRSQGWDYAMFHAVSSALGVGRVWNLTREQLGHAVGLAIVPNVSLLQTRRGELSHWKAFAGPNASRNGVFAADLARHGVTGPGEPFEGVAGFVRQLDHQFALGAFGGAGTPYRVEGTYLKYFPVRYDVQLSVWVALELREQLRVEDIDRLTIHVVRRFATTRAESSDFWDPHTRETADHSLPYLVAAALVDGAISPATFTAQRYRDPQILEVASKIDIRANQDFTEAYPATFHCRFDVVLRDGSTMTVSGTNPRGHPANPMSDDEIEAKFLALVDRRLPVQRARRLLDALWDVDTATSLDPILELMVPPD